MSSENESLPQEAVDAAREQHDKSVAMQRCSCTFGARCDMARVLDALAAERDKVAALQQAVDKVRALHREWEGWCGHCQLQCECIEADDGEIALVGDCTCPQSREWPCPTVALLPATDEQTNGEQ